MKHFKLILSVLSLIVMTNCKSNLSSADKNTFKTTTAVDSNGYKYESVSNDPTGLRLYTLENGLKVYLSQNFDEPKIQSFIAVRAGANYDPKNSTGLAHYLEHMLFKGTSKIGAVNWEKEKVYLKKISDLYEAHRKESDPEKKKLIYKEIDKQSFEASKLAIAQEYDKMVNSIGATNSNAHTWFEETIYKTNIPKNELKKFLGLQGERFNELVLRLFHTELEAVFEEFNKSQDNDGTKASVAKLDALFPNHPYGQQTTIGTAEHLKNPSMVDIHNYFNTYYVPNNMAVVLVGDIDFDETIKNVDATFGKLKRKPFKAPVLPIEKPITKPIIREVVGPTAPYLSIAYRSEGVKTEDEKLVLLCNSILYNGMAGLIDQNLNEPKLVQSASSYVRTLNDYGFHTISGSPKEGQSLDEVKTLLLEQINKLKSGDFEPWLLNAIINDIKKNKIDSYDISKSVAASYYASFIKNKTWEDQLAFTDALKQYTKEDIVKFANSFYKDNYVVVYKKQGKNNTLTKVENPGITPIQPIENQNSEFCKAFLAIKSKPISPEFVDYKSLIKKHKTKNGLEVDFVENKKNDLFQLNFIFDMGGDNDPKLALAFHYVKSLGTDKYSIDQLKEEFYKLGINFKVSAYPDQSRISLSGLRENMDKGVQLMSHLLNNVKPDADVYKKLVKAVLRSRQNKRTDKMSILTGGLLNYAKYGENSRFRNISSEEEFNNINPEDLVNIIKDLKNYKHHVFYYGKDVNQAIETIDANHKINSELKDCPDPKIYTELEVGSKVYFVDFDMVQTEILLVAKGEPFNADNIAKSLIFNDYFRPIVFKEIRESRSLAYSAMARYVTPTEKTESNYILSYIGTQSNKLSQSVDAMLDLMSDMPVSEEDFNEVKEAAIKKISAKRITKTSIFWSYENAKKLGMDYDYRKDIYEAINSMTIQDLQEFFNKNIKGNNYTALVVGNKKDIDFKALSKLGEVEEMDVDFLFNFKKE